MGNDKKTVSDLLNERRADINSWHWNPAKDTENEWLNRVEAAYKHEVSKLRECLKEAVHEQCTKRCMPHALTTKVKILRDFCDNKCQFRKWRNVLEGAE